MKKSYRYDKKTGRCIRIPKRNDPHFHFVQDDTRDTFESPITGELFDSLSKYKQHIKDAGYEITGGEHFTGRGMADFDAKDLIDEDEMAAASREELNKARWGMMPCTDMEKQLWAEEQKKMEGKSNNLMYLREKRIEQMSQKMGISAQELKSRMKMSY